MADVTLTYKGSTIAEMDASGSKTLKTAGKYCEGDIGVSYVKPSGGGGVEIPDSAFVLSGECLYWDYNGKWDTIITAYADKWSANNITDASNMFKNSKLSSLPFDINLGSKPILSSMFYYSSFITLPTIIGNNIEVQGTNNFLNNSGKIKNIPDDYFNFIGDVYGDYSNMSNMLSNCYMLRNFPTSINIIPQKQKSTSVYNSFYYGMCYGCYVLDEITNLGVNTLTTYTKNIFSNVVTSCFRLKNFTFESGKTVNWKNQTIDLTTVGYGLLGISASSYGISSEKLVTNDTSYQALKNDNDWFTANAAYSRYNHDSAVVTINSLPDASAYLATAGGTNTIKFKGAAGSATDGGAINTLTEEEIAVATAKGWTVSLV